MSEHQNELYLDNEKMIEVCRVIGSESRYNIIKIIANEELDITRIANRVGQTEANASAHIKLMQKAGILDVKYEPGIRGVRKIVKLNFNKLVIDLR